MARRPSALTRWSTALTWPGGIVLTSWDYMWRSTPFHRSEVVSTDAAGHRPPPVDPDVPRDDLLVADNGRGPLFHRRYRTRIRTAQLGAEELMTRLQANVNAVAPTKFARFQKVHGDDRRMAVGDEYVVRMPGPWDGPVRVVAVTPRTFRLATLTGHLEAGQIEFRVEEGAEITVEIESWARSSGFFSNVLYHHARMAKEVQLHMWISFLERVVAMSGGRMTGGITIETDRVDQPSG